MPVHHRYIIFSFRRLAVVLALGIAGYLVGLVTAGRIEAGYELAEQEPLVSEGSYDLSRMLRTYAHVRVPLAASYDLLLDQRIGNVHGLTMQQLENMFLNGRGGGWCWLHARILQKTYEYHEMPSVLLDYGMIGSMTHVGVTGEMR